RGDHGDLTVNQIRSETRQPLIFSLRPAVFDGPFLEGGHEVGPFSSRPAVEEANDRHRLLRARRERPCRRAAEQRDELAPLHSIPWWARGSSVGGTSMASALAVERLMTMSNWVGCTTGRSLGFSPLRMGPV